MEAMRCLQRRLYDVIYRQLLADSLQPMGTSPGGHPGNDSDSSATGSHPDTALRKSHFPDPSPTSLELHCQSRLDTEGSHVRRVLTL